MILPYLHARTGLPDIAPETHLRELPEIGADDLEYLRMVIKDETGVTVPEKEAGEWIAVADVLDSMARRLSETQPKAA